jgi:cell wall-associated NlpC family hydrolase
VPAVRPGVHYITGETIATDAQRYEGAGYVYGGNASRPGDWDCSSFISYVLGHDLGMGLPGGVWNGPGMPPHDHGPVVLSYVTWNQADPVPSGQQQPGDLVCWPGLGTGGHIGIVLGQNEMVSALNENYGTAKTPIVGFGPTNSFVFRRVHGTGETPAPAPGGGGAGGSTGETAAALVAGLVVGGGAIAVVLGVAAAAGLILVWAAGRALSAGRSDGYTV